MSEEESYDKKDAIAAVQAVEAVERVSQAEYLGDGLYATFDGFQVEIRNGDHRAPPCCYMERDVVLALVRYATKVGLTTL